MLPYLTPARYAAMGFGSSALDDATLWSIIYRASQAVDRYCSVPMVPTRFSFRGGTVSGEEHRWNPGDGISEEPTRIIWPNCKPVLSVSQLRIYVTNTQYVDFDTDDLFVTKDNVQITSLTLTSSGLFGALIVPVLGLRNPIARISYGYGYDFDAVDEVMARDAVTAGLYRAQNQFWNADAVVVKVDGVTQTITTDYTLDTTEGTVLFVSDPGASALVEVTYGYTLPDEVGQATGLTVAKFIGDKELVEKGMTGVQSIQVGEISIDRPRPRAATSNQSVDLPNEAKQLLTGLHFMSIR